MFKNIFLQLALGYFSFWASHISALRRMFLDVAFLAVLGHGLQPKTLPQKDS